jgi:6-pyruvoyltetrahydropterin/6-carboxytetrahydropterin synthase
MVYRATVRSSYDVALFIPGDQAAAGRTHGHRYTVEAVLEADDVDEIGFVADFDSVQPLLASISAELDHRLLNDLEMFRDKTPSAEAQAEYFYHRLNKDIGERHGARVRLARVRVIQEPDAWVEYEP